MSHLRLSPGEYQAICCLCDPLNLHCYCPHALKRLLVLSLTDRLPELARRIARLGGRDLKLLHDHLRELRRPGVAERRAPTRPRGPGGGDEPCTTGERSRRPGRVLFQDGTWVADYRRLRVLAWRVR